MIAALLLIGYAALAGRCGAGVLLRSSGWAARAPRSAILAWLALASSVVLAVVLAGVALALPYLPLRFELADLLGADTATVAEHYSTPHGAWPVAAALVAVTLAVAMLTWSAARGARERSATRRAQRDTLRMVGLRHPDGFTVVQHDRPLVYCVPGARTRTVVLSSGALTLLDAEERRLVLAHERRHLGGHHDLLLAYAETLARTFGWVPLFAAAHRQVAVLVEMAADDAATTTAERRTLAGALVALGTGSRPDAALGATGTATAQRVRRLTGPAPRPRLGQATLVATAAALVLSAPVTLALAPALEATTHGCCGDAPLAAP